MSCYWLVLTCHLSKGQKTFVFEKTEETIGCITNSICNSNPNQNTTVNFHDSLDTHSLSQTRSIRSTPVLPSLPHLTSSPMFSSASTVAMTSLLPTIQTSSHISPSLVSSRYSSEIVSSSYSLPTTTAVPTDGVTTFKPTPSTVSVNGVPILLNPIDIIVLTSGEVFKYHIPTDTFYDKEDGNTRNLSLSLMDEDYRSITSSSWIFLDQESQSLEGIVVGEDLISETNQFYLAATNSAGRVAYDALTVEVRANEAEYSHQFQVNLSLNYSVFQENVTALYQFFTRLSFHYGSELSELNVFSVVSGSVIITYSNDSIPKTFCDLNSIQVAMGLMVEDNGSVKPEFQETLGRQFPVTSVKLKLIGRCVSFITTSPPDVSFIPQTAQHKLWLSMSTAFIALLCLLLCGFLVYLYSRNKHPGEELLLSNEKPVYIGARKPVILANERSIRRNPRRSYPAVLPDDISPFKPQVKADIEIPLRRLPSDPFLQAQGFDNPVQRIPPPVYCPNPNGGALGGRSLGGRGNPPAYQAPPPYFPPNSYMENKL
ncbi:dystroglycan 1-like isoform X3 [Apostichopus japonicus]|uniref:dystroglycan 1-like isoform X3 n=1 Tax=Stichopus japonicus TaxID=307972 RepID=UPI003AB63A6A